MKTLYLECNMGAAGDMLTAALSELLEDPEAFTEEMKALDIPGVRYEREYKTTAGIRGAHMHVYVHDEEEHTEDVDMHEHHHDGEHDEGHSHEHNDDHDHGHEHSHIHECGAEHSHEYTGDDAENDAGGHSHEHHHDHDGEHNHHHDHGEDHDYGHEHSHEEEHCHDHGEGHCHDHEDVHNHNHAHEHHHHHHHTSMADIRAIVEKLAVSSKVKQDIIAVYSIIAEAESEAHGKSVEEVHFHEVGAMDAVADITAVCLLMEKIGAEKIICSPVHVGSGMVRCAHGILPVPAPATASILRGVPCYSGTIKGELCTPTGAALLKYFSDSFGSMPVMAASKIGIGVGTKEFEAANMIRAYLGESEAENENVYELSCNLDDCTGEELGYACEMLMKEGALDAFTAPIQMKKSRPAFLFTVIAEEKDADRLSMLMLKHTTTLGVRRKLCTRIKLDRHTEEIETGYGKVRVKISEGYGIKRVKPEYDDIAGIASEKGITLEEVLKMVKKEADR